MINRIENVRGDSPSSRDHLYRTGNGEGGDTSAKENLMSVEVGLADLEKDTKVVAEIFSQPSVIEHLAGVAPKGTERNISGFRRNILKYMSKDSGIDDERLKELGKTIFQATKEEIREYYKNSTSSELYVAKINGEVVGTITLEKPTGSGMLWAGVSKMAVSQEARGKGVATKLLRTLIDRMSQLGFQGATAGIIRGVEGDSIPLHLFEEEGFESRGTLKKICLGWSKIEGKFIYRDSIRMEWRAPQPQKPLGKSG